VQVKRPMGIKYHSLSQSPNVSSAGPASIPSIRRRHTARRSISSPEWNFGSMSIFSHFDLTLIPSPRARLDLRRSDTKVKLTGIEYITAYRQRARCVLACQNKYLFYRTNTRTSRKGSIC